MSLKDSWKNTGKEIGHSFAGLGKSIVKSAKAGLEAVKDGTPEEQEKQPKDTGLRESWSEVGHSFGAAGKSLGKSVAGTAKKVVDSVEHGEKPKDEDENE